MKKIDGKYNIEYDLKTLTVYDEPDRYISFYGSNRHCIEADEYVTININVRIMI